MAVSSRLPMVPPSPVGGAATAAITYEDLYARWERGNWRATEIDFTADRRDWEGAFSDIERRAALWNYSLFFCGEDAVANTLSPYIDAAPREEQKYFLATQQVDEARHAVFFRRFLHEVAGVGDGSTGSALHALDTELTWGFRRVFARLDRMADELRADRSRPMLARAVTLYHIIIEASLAQPGQHLIESDLDRRGVLPGFREGIRNVSLDEQRHIGFGVKLLSELIAQDGECADAVVELINEVIPITTPVFVPPGWDMRYIESFGVTMEDVYEQGAISLEAKLRAMGLPESHLARISLPVDLPPRERAERGIKLLRAGFLGEKNGPPARDREAIAIMFDGVRRTADPRVVPPGTVVQWDFTDSEPWHLRIDNGSTVCVEGRAADPDLVLACRLEDWVDLVAGRANPRSLLLRRRLRPHGSLRMLARLPRMFGA